MFSKSSYVEYMFYLSWNQFVHHIFYQIPISSALKLSRILGELCVFSLLLTKITPPVLLGEYPVNDSIFLLHLLSHCSSSTLSHPHWQWEKLVSVVITAHSIRKEALINRGIIFVLLLQLWMSSDISKYRKAILPS